MQNWTHCVLKWNLQNSEWNGWTDWNWLKLSLAKICIFLLLQRRWIWFLRRDLQTVYKRDTCTFAPFYFFNSNFLKIKCWGKMNTDEIFLFFTATILLWKKNFFQLPILCPSFNWRCVINLSASIKILWKHYFIVCYFILSRILWFLKIYM